MKPEVKKLEPKLSEEPKETTVPVPPPIVPPPVAQRENSSSNSLETEEHYFNTNGHVSVGVDGPFSFPPPTFSVPPPTEFYGGWHQPFWNSSAPSWITQPPPDAVPLNSNHEEEKKEEEQAVLDLDTRIELLLKGKISAALNTPAFLQLQLDGSSSSDSSRSSSRAADHDKNMENCASPPLSPPPSPFLSQEIYLDYHRAAHPETPQG